MKKNIFLISLFLLSSLYAEVLFRIDDPAGDDYGNGKILYPENPMYSERVFDIQSFEFALENENYLIKIRTSGKIEPVEHDEFRFNYNLTDNFILPLIHIYIDNDHVMDSGFTETINGVNATIAAENAWEKVIIIASLPDRYRGDLNRYQPEVSYNAFIPEKITISRDRRELSVEVPKSFLGEVNQDWGFTVLMLCQDYSQTVQKSIYVKDIKSTASQHNFGGGEGNLLQNYDSNIIDMLVPSGSDQKRILNSYDQENKKLAELKAVYPSASKLISARTVGEVKQISDEKVVINLGSDNGVEVGSQLIINNKIVVIAEDVFTQLTIASLQSGSAGSEIAEGMKVTLLNK